MTLVWHRTWVMRKSDEDIVLLTIRVRRDPAYPASKFISLRRYSIDLSTEPDRSAEVTTVDEAVVLTSRWLREPSYRAVTLP